MIALLAHRAKIIRSYQLYVASYTHNSYMLREQLKIWQGSGFYYRAGSRAGNRMCKDYPSAARLLTAIWGPVILPATW
jgi:hypothetical protein